MCIHSPSGVVKPWNWRACFCLCLLCTTRCSVSSPPGRAVPITVGSIKETQFSIQQIFSNTAWTYWFARAAMKSADISDVRRWPRAHTKCSYESRNISDNCAANFPDRNWRPRHLSGVSRRHLRTHVAGRGFTEYPIAHLYFLTWATEAPAQAAQHRFCKIGTFVWKRDRSTARRCCRRFTRISLLCAACVFRAIQLLRLTLRHYGAVPWSSTEID